MGWVSFFVESHLGPVVLSDLFSNAHVAALKLWQKAVELRSIETV